MPSRNKVLGNVIPFVYTLTDFLSTYTIILILRSVDLCISFMFLHSALWSSATEYVSMENLVSSNELTLYHFDMSLFVPGITLFYEKYYIQH